MANTYATFTNNTVPSTSKFTWSAWVKRAKLGTQQALFSGAQSSTTGQMIYFNGAADQLGFYGIASSTVRVDKYTTMKFRDVNAWYHIVVAYDSTLSTASDRVKFYVNGELQQLNGTDVQVQGWEPYYMLTYPTDIGRDAMGTSSYFDGEMSHMNFVIGTVYDASAFGETDSTTGEWKIKTSPSVTYSSDGFFILKDGNSVTDQSGNGNNFTVGGGTLTKTEDNPSNVFATWNGIADNLDVTLSNGNTSVAHGSQIERRPVISSLGNSTGKFYAEFKPTSGASGNIEFGIVTQPSPSAVGRYMNQSPQNCGSVSYINDGSIQVDGTATSGLSTYTANDIIGVAVDKTNELIYFYKNGTLVNAGGTNFSGITAGDGNFYFCNADRSGGSTYNSTANFGNGYFGTTAVASAGTNASNNGIFEYDVPTGFTALSTKGLNL